MFNQSKLSIIKICTLLLFATCQTMDKDVAQLVHQKKETSLKINPHKDAFAKNIQGSYALLNSELLTINNSGHFKLGEVDYFLFDAISDTQGIYVATTPLPNGTKKVYTYHGIIYTGKQLLHVPYKEPSFENKKVLTAKDTEFYWQVNTFQPENINWDSGFTPLFATKQ